MIRRVTLQVLAYGLTLASAAPLAGATPSLGEPGLSATYRIAGQHPDRASAVESLRVALGPSDTWNGREGQWLHLEAAKQNGESFAVWMLCDGLPPARLEEAGAHVLRYLLQQGSTGPVEYRHALTRLSVLPGSGGWPYLLPRPAEGAPEEGLFSEEAHYLGHVYQREDLRKDAAAGLPLETALHLLRPDVLTGVPHNTRQVDETRRYDDSEYDYIPLVQKDFETMIAAGLNCFHASPSEAPWFEAAGVFYWGVGGADVRYPECLYQPLYIGPALFLDEPAVVTRDSMIRPRLREDEAFRRSITPQDAMAAFEEHYAEVIANGAPPQFLKGLAARGDVDLGTMQFVQPNLYSWETMASAAAYELLYDPATPNAIVFEPPGQLGTRRTLPAMNMSYGCQIPVTGSDHFIDIIIGFLRGAARASGKEWGISIYGGVDRTEAAAFVSRSYELGATRFFYWDSARLACVPFGEVLDLTRHLSSHAQEYPNRDLARLLHAGEVAILLPPGYNLGHVYMGKGILWGVPELNLERLNREGVPYRTVMGSFFTEIERCIRLGIAFDLLWDLPAANIQSQGYREVVRVREDGKVELTANGQTAVLEGPRTPERPEGKAPRLEITPAETSGTAPCAIQVQARIWDGDAPVYYAPAPDANGVHHKRQVLWELYGPNSEDYSSRPPEIRSEPAETAGSGEFAVSAMLHFQKPGHYRLRAAATDLAGRSSVVWTELEMR